MSSKSDTDFTPFRGGCLCGAIRYSVHEPPAYQLLCLCTDCQAVGGGFGTGSMVVPATSIRMEQGTLTTFIKPDRPNLKRQFCATCGTQVLATNMAPHNVYPCAEPQTWVAIAVADDDEWQRLCQAVEVFLQECYLS